MMQAHRVEVRDYNSGWAMAEGVARMTFDCLWGVQSVTVTPERFLRVVFVRRGDSWGEGFQTVEEQESRTLEWEPLSA